MAELVMIAAAPTGGGLEAADLAPFLLVSGVVIIAVMLVRATRGRIARRNATEVTPRERIAEIKRGPSRAREEADDVAAELVEIATRLCAQIDARAERLERLIRHADERLDLLEGGATPSGEDRDPVVAALPRETNGEETAPERPRGARDAGEPPLRDPLAIEICRLADEGLSPVEIAQQLDEHVGKVDLILALRRTG